MENIQSTLKSKADNTTYESFQENDPGEVSSRGLSPESIHVDLLRSMNAVSSSQLNAEDLLSVDTLDEATRHLIADEAVAAAGTNGKIACIACGGVYLTLKEAHPERTHLDVFMDFDPRFLSLGENIVIIPMNEPLKVLEKLPSRMHHVFSATVFDISYLDNLQLEQVMEMARLLGIFHDALKVIIIGTEEMAGRAGAAGLRMARLRPHGRTGNIRIYTSIWHPRRLQ